MYLAGAGTTVMAELNIRSEGFIMTRRQNSSSVGQYASQSSAESQNGYTDRSVRRCVRGTCRSRRSFASMMLRARKLFVERNSREETRALAREVSMMQPADYAAAFKGSAIKRAKL